MQEFFDGTIIAQKALSCIYRLKASEPISVVIDVLRGSQNEVVRKNNYQELSTYGIGKDISWQNWQQYIIQLINLGLLELSTYGIGKDISWQNWQQYIIQLINLGLLEIAFDKNNHLQLTENAKSVLFSKEKVFLADVKQQVEKAEKDKKESASNSLFEKLRQLRLSIAKEEDIPAYLIFNDAALKDMEKQRPMSDAEFLLIDGVGRKKMEDYGYRFIKEIIAFSKDKREKKPKTKRSKKSNTFKETLEFD